MRYYYFHDGEHQSGPFDIAELAPCSLKSDTAVWHAELEYWVWVSQLEELKDFIKREETPKTKQPPLFDKGKIKTDTASVKRRLKLILFAVLFIVTFVATLSFITSFTKKTGYKYESKNHTRIEGMGKYNKANLQRTSKSESAPVKSEKEKMADKVSEKEREIIKTAEKREPTKFLLINAKLKPSLLGNKLMVTASITNTAKLTKYKDVLIEITYYDKFKDPITTGKEVAYIDITPGSRVDFKLKTTMPPGSRTADCRILTAIHYY